ncbi:MAG: SAM-dependent methyltransferase [Bacteroidota bacterium]
MPNNTFQQFNKILSESITKGEFVKITLSNKRNNADDLKNVFVKTVNIKKGLALSFVYRYPTKDITKNLSINEGLELIINMLDNIFFQANLFTTKSDWHLLINKNNSTKLTNKPAIITEVPNLNHNNIKNRFLNSENNIYLRELGIVSHDWKIKADMQDKFKQINKYIEIIDGIINSAKIESKLKIADMGSGKGYLTFALYDFLTNTRKLTPEVYGVEYRKELVDFCNEIAQKSKFSNLTFKSGSIAQTDISGINMLIALHACDTATDDAIFKGIQANAQIIICAPCCHKQIRAQMKPNNALKEITKHGILLERQAETITDTIRGLILEAYGYKTKIFEFIETEHTPKNVLIVGVKKDADAEINSKKLAEVSKLKELFGIEMHYLESLLHEI